MSRKRKRSEATFLDDEQAANNQKIWFVCLTCHRALTNFAELGSHRYEQHALKSIAGLILDKDALNPVVRVEPYRHCSIPVLELEESSRTVPALKRQIVKANPLSKKVLESGGEPIVTGKRLRASELVPRVVLTRLRDAEQFGKPTTGKTIFFPEPTCNAGETQETTPEMEIKTEDFTMSIIRGASFNAEVISENNAQTVSCVERLGSQTETLPFGINNATRAEIEVAEDDPNEDFGHFDEVQQVEEDHNGSEGSYSHSEKLITEAGIQDSAKSDDRGELGAKQANKTEPDGSFVRRTMTRPTRARRKFNANLKPHLEDECDSESSAASSYAPSHAEETDTDGEDQLEKLGDEFQDGNQSSVPDSRKKLKYLKPNSLKPFSYTSTKPVINKHKRQQLMSELLWAWCSNRSCRVAFNTKDQLTKHCIRAPSHRGSIKFSCEACRAEFDHSAHEGEDHQSISECQKCAIDDQTVSTQHGDKCELAKMTKVFQKNHVASRVRQFFECSVCFLNFDHLGKFIQHQKSDHSEEELLKRSSATCNTASPVVPTQVEGELKAMANIEGNVIERHEEAQAPASGSVSASELSVDSIPKTFVMEKKSRFTGVIHKIKHGAQLSCRYCAAKFPIIRLLNDHIKFLHLKKYQCDTCPKFFSYRGALERHRTYDHTGRKDFLCTVCGKAFIRPEFLERHVKVVHEDRDKFHCDMCVKRFACPAALNRHKKYHTVKERNHLCPDCGKAFKMKNDLASHLRKKHVKLAEDALKCFKPTCNFKCFGDKTLQSHIRLQHVPQECSHCGKMYSNQLVLKEHMRKLSPTVGKYPCEVCKVRFTKKKYLREHGPKCSGPGSSGPRPEDESPSSTTNKATISVEPPKE